MNKYLNKTEKEIESLTKFNFKFSINIFKLMNMAKKEKPQKTGYRDNRKSLGWWQIKKKIDRFFNK